MVILSGLFWHQAEDRARSRIPVRLFLIIVAMMGQKYQKETVFTNRGGDFYFYTMVLPVRTGLRKFCIDWGKKEAQIEIQAVAKIQYPIKSQLIYCKLNSTSF